MEYGIGTQVQVKGYSKPGTITEIRPLGYSITGNNATEYVRIRPGLDYTKTDFEREVEEGKIQILN